MIRIRYLTLLVLLLGSISIWAQDDIFDPVSPSEPGPPTIYSRIVLLRNIDDAGSVSGAGRYAVGSSVNVYAYMNSSYTFLNWTDTKGNELSKATSFAFLNTVKTDTLIANYAFTPGNPSEPSEPSTTLYYRLGYVHAGMHSQWRRPLSGREEYFCVCLRGEWLQLPGMDEQQGRDRV